MASVLGDEGVVASRIGNDDLGREAYGIMQELGMNASYVQHDDLHETGTAKVSIDASGQPNFTIKESVSWDFLQWTSAWQELSARADVVCFGSLGQRSSNSAATIECFLRNTRKKALRICDVNLRQSFYNREVLLRSFQHAQVVKLNEQEILQHRQRRDARQAIVERVWLATDLYNTRFTRQPARVGERDGGTPGLSRESGRCNWRRRRIHSLFGGPLLSRAFA
jgi:sugar/nucleoside kinase (ribokinase family)